MNWLGYALLSALFAGLVAVFGKLGVREVDSTLATAVRACIMTHPARGGKRRLDRKCSSHYFAQWDLHHPGRARGYSVVALLFSRFANRRRYESRAHRPSECAGRGRLWRSVCW